MRLGSLAACIAITLRLYANHKGIELDGVDVRLELDRIHAEDCEYIKRIKMPNMRTTIEIPDELLRQAKAHAALRGMKLKELVAEALEAALYYPSDRASAPRVAEGTEEEANVLVLADNCVFPLIRGDCGPAMRDATGDKLNAILEEEEVERAPDSRRR